MSVFLKTVVRVLIRREKSCLSKQEGFRNPFLMQKHKEQEILPSVFITKETRMKKTTTAKIISVIMANFLRLF